MPTDPLPRSYLPSSLPFSSPASPPSTPLPVPFSGSSPSFERSYPPPSPLEVRIRLFSPPALLSQSPARRFPSPPHPPHPPPLDPFSPRNAPLPVGGAFIFPWGSSAAVGFEKRESFRGVRVGRHFLSPKGAPPFSFYLPVLFLSWERHYEPRWAIFRFRLL